MSFVPSMQSYFGKDTDISKLSGTAGNAAALGVRADIQGDVIQDQAKKRAQMRIMQGEMMKDQGQAAGSSAVNNGFINAGVSAISGGLQGAFSEGGIFNRGGDIGGFAGSEGVPGFGTVGKSGEFQYGFGSGGGSQSGYGTFGPNWGFPTP